MLRLSLAVFTLLGVVALTACSGEPSPAQPRKIAGSFEELLAHRLSLPNLNEFERGVYKRAMETGRINQADYHDAFARFSACMSEHGKPIALKKLKNGLYRWEIPPLAPDETADQVLDAASGCQSTTTGYIPELFQIQQVNSELLADPHEVAYRCVVRAGLLPSGYSIEQFTAAVFPQPVPGKARTHSDTQLDVMSDDVQACLIGAGITVLAD